MRNENSAHFMRPAVIVATVLLSAMLSIVAVPRIAQAFNSWEGDISWYMNNPSADVFEISTPAEFATLAQLVNGTYDYDDDLTPDYAPISFKGKTIRITADLTGLDTWLKSENRGQLECIGTEATPFEGTIIGWNKLTGSACEREICYTMTLDATVASVSPQNVGLFGYVGESGSIQYLTIDNNSRLTITLDFGALYAEDATEEVKTAAINKATADTKMIKNVGMLAGYCGGTISNCNSRGTLVITANGYLSHDVRNAVRNVGGIVGICVNDIDSCTFTGSVALSSTSASYIASADEYEGISEGFDFYVVENIGGICGCFGNETAVEGKHAHGTVTNCTNSGTISTRLLGDPVYGERFLEWVFPEGGAVGGIAGYSYGSISKCNNSGYIDTCTTLFTADDQANPNYGRDTYSGADGAAGICGKLRGETASGSADSDVDEGRADDELTISDCSNSGRIDAYHAGAGIAGCSGTYTTITRCANTGDVNVYRWNKPSGAGIVGQPYGDVTFCYNCGTVTSIAGAGFYCAGIAAMMFRYWDAAMNPLSPEPEIYGCYNAGAVKVESGGADWKQAGICGQSDGYVHDNILLKGTCYNDRVDNGQNSDYGTWGYNAVMTSEELKSDAALAILNTMSASDGWTSYYTLVQTTSEGYPMLNTQVDPALLGQNDLSSPDANVTVTLLQNASYTGLVALPTVQVVYNGITLVQDVNFKVIPQANATAFTGEETPYKATIVGVGMYSGTLLDAVNYGISAGDLSTCTVIVQATTFNWENQQLAKEKITVKDAAGNVVDPAYWSYSVEGDANGETRNYKKNGYTVTITPAVSDGVQLYNGTVTGQYMINKASINGVCIITGLEYDGAKYYWDDDNNTWVNGVRPAFAYTGQSIKPTIISLTYLGEELVLGRDYRLIYGNPNSETDTSDGQNANTEITSEDNSSIACVTARFVSLNSEKIYNFSNFTNLFFDIVDPETTLPSFVAENQLWTGSAVTPFAGTYHAQDSWILTEGVDYSVEYSANVDCGYVTYTVTGLGKYANSVKRTGQFAIYKNELPEFSVEAQHYTGEAVTPFVGTYVAGSKILTEGVDYTVTYTNNKNVGTCDFVVKGIGEYSGQQYKGTFNIYENELPDVVIAAQEYTGEVLKPLTGSFKAQSGESEITLVEGTDYFVVYTNNTEIGEATYTLTGIGAYEGCVKTGTFEIIAPSTAKILKFDFNNDGILNAYDLARMRLIIAGRLVPANEQQALLWRYVMDFKFEENIEGSTVYNALDLTQMRLRIAGRTENTYVDVPSYLLAYK